MVERIISLTAVVLIVLTALPGCSMLTAQGRRERAYERYVRKCSHQRDRLQAKMLKTQQQIPTLPPSEPKVTTMVGGSPESVTSDDSPAFSGDSNSSAEGSN
jgi:hypothetical protein